MPTSSDRQTCVSIVVPVYNERNTWREIIDRVVAVDLPGCRKQLVIVDDASSDGTRGQLERFRAESDEQLSDASGGPVDVAVIFHERNMGKGAALRTGFERAGGEIVLIQDADLEYDPRDYSKLLGPLLDGRADVVYGSRFSQGGRKGSRKNYLANRFLTWLSNRFTGLGLTDMETCYKAFRTEVLRRVELEQDRFGFEPEITARIAKLGVRVCEVPIRYEYRTAGEGKKIGFRDGLNAIWCILKYA